MLDCPKFQPYFNNSLGIVIESPEHLKKLEKQGTIFLSIDEHEREQKRIKKEIKDKKAKVLSGKIQDKLSQVRWGRSFYNEELKKAGYR